MRSRLSLLVAVVLLVSACSGGSTVEGTVADSTTLTSTTDVFPSYWGTLAKSDVDVLVASTTEVAVNVVAGLNEPDPGLFLAQFQPGAKVIDPIRPNLRPSVADFHTRFRTLCAEWGVEDVFVNEGGSLAKGTCEGFYDSVSGAPESAYVVRHLPMTDGLATGLMHRLHADITGRFPEETVTIIGFPASVRVEVAEQVEAARSFEETLVDAWMSGDPSPVAALYAPEGFREDGLAEVPPTHEGTVAWLTQLHETYDEVDLEVEEVFASGLGPAATYRLVLHSPGSVCSMYLASVWNLDDNGLIEQEYVFYHPDSLKACSS